jgi:hypothetical protein
MASEVVAAVVAREVQKTEMSRENHSLLELRIRMADLKRRFPNLVAPGDENLLIEPERAIVTVKRPPRNLPPINTGLGAPGMSENTPAPSGVIKLPRRSLRDTDILQLPYADGGEPGINPHERAAVIQRDTERFLETRKRPGWEDHIDVSVVLTRRMSFSLTCSLT